MFCYLVQRMREAREGGSGRALRSRPCNAHDCALHNAELANARRLLRNARTIA